MGITGTIDITPKQRKEIIFLLSRYLPGVQVWAFGSRVRWTSRPDSDLDLVAFSVPEQKSAIAALKEAFEESSLPFRVDLLVWDEVPDNFQQTILKEYVVLIEKTKGTQSEFQKFDMAGEWVSTTLGELCEFRAGSVFKPDLQGQSSGQYPFVKVSDMNLPSNAVRIQDANNWVSENDLQTLKAKPFPSGTVVFAKIGEALRQNRLRQIFRDTIVDNNMMGAIPRFDRVDPQFFYYALSQFDFSHIAQGTALPYLTVSSLSALELDVPPFEEQRAIAHILGTLDDKIELNRRMNETLEEMARAIFKSWFIDFDPVRRNMAKKAGQNQPSPRPPLPKGEGHYRGGYDFSGLLRTVRELRSKQTPAEAIFWELVRDRQLLGLKFRRQHQLGDYIADFYCHELRLAIELDGGVHASKQKKDRKRDAWMIAQGFEVLRFTNEQILNAPESAMEQIAAYCADKGAVSLKCEGFSSLPVGEGQGEGCGEAFDALFPDSFEDSELGEIPKGWVVKPLSEVLDVNPTRSLRKGEIAPYLDMANMPTRGHAPDDVVERPFGSGMRFMNGDTLVARITPCLENGKTAFVDFLHEGQVGWGSTEYIVLRPKPPLPDEYAYCLARSNEFREFAIQNMTGSSGRQRVPAESLLHFNVALPSKKVADQFRKTITPIFARARAAAFESHSLAALRDTLLPKLISGELRVKNAEKFVGGNV